MCLLLVNHSIGGSALGHRLGGVRGLAPLNAEERLKKLENSAAFGGKHVPAKVEKNGPRLAGRIRTMADLKSKLNNDTVASKLKKR